MNNVMKKIGDFYQDHKGEILIASGIIGTVIIGTILTRNGETNEEELLTKLKTDNRDYEIYQIQSNDPNKSYTIDLPVSNDSTVESDLKGLLDDITNGNWYKADL